MSNHYFWLLAQGERIDDMGRRFRRGGSSLDLGHVWLLVLLMVVVVVAAVIAHRIVSARNKPGYNSPGALFVELCKAHGLRRSQRQLLLRVARQNRLQHPARLFVEPERFESANLGTQFPGQSQALRAIRNALFGKHLRTKQDG